MSRVMPEHIEMDQNGIVHCAACGAPVGQRRPLTPKQAAVFAFCATFIQKNGASPSFGEIAAHTGVKTTSTVHRHLISLEKKGWLMRGYNTARDITILATEEYEWVNK